jgi:hypothetical protein
MRRTVIVMLTVAIVLDVAYWTIWLTRRGWIASEDTQAYYRTDGDAIDYLRIVCSGYRPTS